MRYDELTLPLGETDLHLQFHPRLTVLAGLSGPQRRMLIDAVVQLNRGAVRGGNVSLIDAGGRSRIIDDSTVTDPAVFQQRSAGAWRSLLAVGAEDLGLPRASDDPGGLAQRRELEATRVEAERLRATLAQAEAARQRHDQAVAELAATEERLADLGTATDRRHHNRARALVEVEQIRATLEALDAPPRRIERDGRLIATTEAIEQLADDWADASERRDRLAREFGNRSRLDADEIAGLVSVPDEIPEPLAAAIAERDRLRAVRSDAKARLKQSLSEPSLSAPTDSRVLTLAALDQETLWLTHRNVLLATEALHEVQRAEQARMVPDPADSGRLEAAHDAAEQTAAVVERRWLPNVLAATVTACAAALLLVMDLWLPLVPLLLTVSVAFLVGGVAIPRLHHRRAAQLEAEALAAVDASNIAEYRARFSDNPDSERYQRAEAVIEEYRVAHQEWHGLVGTISPADASQLEPAVHDWAARMNRTRRDRETTRIRREIEHTTTAIADATRRLGVVLEPFGLDPHATALAATLQERVLQGRKARLQVALNDAEEAEAKVTRLLGTELAALGFEDGSLSTRISAYGRELDAAAQRDRLRRNAPPRADLEARRDQLQMAIDMPAPPTATPERDDRTSEDPTVVALRQRRDELTGRIAAFANPETGGIERRLRRLDGRIAGLEASLATERGLVVAKPVDHLVETLIRYRPVWPTTESELAPAFLDDPFAATSPALKRQLLDAVVEVTRVVQVVLLTGDDDSLAWARAAEARGALSVVAPAVGHT